MTKQPASKQPAARRSGTYTKRGRFWAVTDGAGRLVCLAVYKKGAKEVLRRLNAPMRATERRRLAKRRRRSRGKERGD